MKKITLSEYNSISEAYRGVWTTERWDIPDWAEMRKKHINSIQKKDVNLITRIA